VVILAALLVGVGLILGYEVAIRPSPPSSTVGTTTTYASLNETVALREAIQYLVTNYDSRVGLVSETTNSDVFYIYSDNYAVVQVLHQARSMEPNLPAIADNISRTIGSYFASLGNAKNQYMVIGNNWNASCSFNLIQTYNVSQYRGVQIKADVNNKTGQLLDSEYADIAFLKAICYQNQGDHQQALQEFNQGKAFFNGTGFNDWQYSNNRMLLNTTTMSYNSYSSRAYYFGSYQQLFPSCV